MGFLILLIVTVGAAALGTAAATGMLLLLFHLMRPTVVNPQMPLKADATVRSA